MKKNWIWVVFSLFVVVSAYGSESQPSEPDNSSSESNGTEKSKSTFDRVIEAIVEAAINNPDYGRDISGS